MAARRATRDLKDYLETAGFGRLDNPIVEQVLIEHTLLRAGYTYTEICGMEVGEVLKRYAVLKEWMSDGG